jgi:hypothetical protein
MSARGNTPHCSFVEKSAERGPAVDRRAGRPYLRQCFDLCSSLLHNKGGGKTAAPRRPHEMVVPKPHEIKARSTILWWDR